MINSKPPEHETAQIVNISEEGAKHLKNRSRPQPAGSSRRADGFASVFLSLGLAEKVLVCVLVFDHFSDGDGQGQQQPNMASGL